VSSATPEPHANHGKIMLGVVITAAGLLLLIEQLNLADIHLTSRVWPLFPLGLGLLRVIDPPLSGGRLERSRRSGAWLVFIGIWGLMNELHTFGFDYGNSWPLVVIFAGVNMVWRSAERPAKTLQGGAKES
jgi:hypothetical protein